mmetsp:Transcript_65998/g.107081  ORF Transcript_65998/g.107081 Transcript_65998/m.107081 type:complete len:228 (-) Transcript_65998:399-1082(-)
MLCGHILGRLHVLHSGLLHILYVLLTRCHDVLLRLLRHLRNILLMRLRDRHHHCLLHWLLLRGLLRIHVLATHRLRGSRRLIRRLVTIRSTCKIDFIELARITPKSKFHRCTRRPWNLVTQNIEALPVNVFAINQLQHIARLDAICLVGWPTLDKAFHVHQHATTARVNSLPEFDSHATELSAVRNGCRGRSCRLRHGLGHVHNLHCPSAGGRGLIILDLRLLHWRC